MLIYTPEYLKIPRQGGPWVRDAHSLSDEPLLASVSFPINKGSPRARYDRRLLYALVPCMLFAVVGFRFMRTFDSTAFSLLFKTTLVRLLSVTST